MHNLDTRHTVVNVIFCNICLISNFNQTYISRNNKTITTTPTTHPVTHVRKLTYHAMMKKKTLERFRALRDSWTPKPTQESTMGVQIATLFYNESAEYESLEVSTYKIGEYDDEFVYKLIKKYKMLNDLKKLYETTTLLY